MHPLRESGPVRAEWRAHRAFICGTASRRGQGNEKGRVQEIRMGAWKLNGPEKEGNIFGALS